MEGIFLKKLIVNKKYDKYRIDKYIMNLYPSLSFNSLQKAFRKKDIKVNGKKANRDYQLSTNDSVEVFIKDNILEGITQSEEHYFSVVYEDSKIIIVNKQQGISVHPGRNNSQKTLITLINSYLGDKIQAYLCHRLDRNTGGLIIIAKSHEVLKSIQKKLETNEIKKHYTCIVDGIMEKKTDTSKAYLIKNEKKSRVFVYDKKVSNATKIITKYNVIKTEDNSSTLEVELITGKTHQIRAHLAHIGHPILGDKKYGLNKINKKSPFRYQCLWAHSLEFRLESDCPALNYLKGKKFYTNPDFK